MSSKLSSSRMPWVRVLACVVALGASASGHASERALTKHLAALAATLDARERAVLAHIPEDERRLLALRAYLRAGPSLRARWSWTDDEIRRYRQSQEYVRLLADLNGVRSAFERANPGFSLYANTEVRSLDTQIERWNSNPRVGNTARSLYRSAVHAIEQTRPGERSAQALKQHLLSWRPAPVSPLAAPGLSLHGQMRAIDFQVMRGERVVAATEVGAVQRDWRATGWDRKLRRAVDAAGGRFAGPLQSPNEPWHYEYVGTDDRTAAQ